MFANNPIEIIKYQLNDHPFTFRRIIIDQRCRHWSCHPCAVYTVITMSTRGEVNRRAKCIGTYCIMHATRCHSVAGCCNIQETRCFCLGGPFVTLRRNCYQVTDIH